MRPVIIGIAAALALFSAGCQKLQSRDQLNRGVQAFKNAQYQEAVERFKTAVQLDPTFPPARLYLATAYMQQYIPGAISPENDQMAKAANENFMKVLEMDPKNTVALASLASFISMRRSGKMRSNGTTSWWPSIRIMRMPITAWVSSLGPSGIRPTE